MRAAGKTALSLSDSSSGSVTACGGPGLGACDVRSGLAAPAYAASVACGAGVSEVSNPAIRARL